MKVLQRIGLFGITGLLAVHTTAQSSGNVCQVVEDSHNHTTLYEAIKTTDLTKTLTDAGPYTIFAPSNEAFTQLPAGDWEGLKHSESKQELTKFLSYHIVSGKYDEQALRDAIKKGNGSVKLRTIAGGKLTFRLVDDSIVLTDGKGNDTAIGATDMDATNGVVHSIDSVLLKK
ncbi:MAG: fasciclin domain-containing protein [Bacteroidota bacterium]